MPLHRQPTLPWSQYWKASTLRILTAALVGTLLSPPIAAGELKTADEIVRALSGGEATAGAQEPALQFRGVRPRPKVASEPQTERNIDLTIHFATNSAVIEPRSRSQIQEIAAAARQLDLGQAHLWIVGHTDSRGSATYNLDLSRRRARAVKQALVAEHGLPGDSLRAEGKGETELLIAPERTPADYASNRRVELKLVQRPGAGH